jgi:hypothetical protein
VAHGVGADAGEHSRAEFATVSTFPWGESLFIGQLADAIRLGNKFSPFGPGWSGTANLDGYTDHNAASIQGAGGAVLAELHAEAIALGWEIHGIQPRTGRYGDYQMIAIVRRGFAG